MDKNIDSIISDYSNHIIQSLIIVQNRLYAQLESLIWLQHQMTIKQALPPLRGWAASPDVLLHLHSYILRTKPQVVVEFGSGASTIVIADALRQNNSGLLYSLEHDAVYAGKSLAMLQQEGLDKWVQLRIGQLEPWNQELSSIPASFKDGILWYPISLLDDISQIDLIFVDGPPAKSSYFSRYPAIPVLYSKLTHKAQIWLDDTIRTEEQEICKEWIKYFNLSIETLSLEKGLSILKFKDKQTE